MIKVPSFSKPGMDYRKEYCTLNNSNQDNLFNEYQEVNRVLNTRPDYDLPRTLLAPRLN